MKPLFFPPHDRRAESPAYKRVHDRLVIEENRPCAIGGVTNAAVARSPVGASRAISRAKRCARGSTTTRTT